MEAAERKTHMQKQNSIKNRYLSFAVSAALGLGILAPACFVHAAEATGADEVAAASSEAAATETNETGGSDTVNETTETTGTSGNSDSSEASTAVADTEGSSAVAATGEADGEDSSGAGTEAAATSAAATNANETTESENSSAEDTMVTVTITDSRFGDSSFELESGAAIGSNYSPLYKTYREADSIGIMGTYTLIPSTFKSSQTGQVYTLAQLQELNITADSSFEVTNYTRRFPLTFYTWDGRPSTTNFELGTFTIRKGGNAFTGEIALQTELSPLNYVDITADDTTGSSASTRLGWTSLMVYLDHLDDSGKVASYAVDYFVFPANRLTDSTYSNANLSSGGYYSFQDLVPYWYQISVSDANPSNQVETSVDVAYTSWGGGVYEGQKMVSTRTSTSTVATDAEQIVVWKDSTTNDFTLTRADGSTVENTSIFRLELSVVGKRLDNGLFNVKGVADVQVTPHEIEGYTAVVEGDGLSRASVYQVSYYRQIPLTFDFGDGEGTAEDVIVLHTLPLSSVLEELPEATAPEGYRFAGWTVNGELVSLDYVPSTTEALTLTASYVKDGAAPEPEEPGTPAGPSDSADSSADNDASAASDKKDSSKDSQKQDKKKEIAKTGDSTTAMPALLTLGTGAAALAIGAAAANSLRLRRNKQD